MILAVPPATAVTTPFDETVATLSLLEVQVTVFIVAFVGATLSVILKLVPASTVFVFGEIVTEVTGITTLTSHEAL